MKRLLCLISNMNSGGAETFLMKIYRALDKTKYQMDFCINIEGDCFYKTEIEQLGGRIYHIPSKSMSIKEFKKNLTNIICKYQYQNVLRITSSAMGFMDLEIAKKAGAQVCVARSSNSSDGNGIKAYIVHRLGKLLYNKYVDVKIAPSDLAAKYTFGGKAYQKGNVTILHNAVDLDTFYYDINGRQRIRSEFNIENGTKIIGHIGRFMNQKNHSFLIDVFFEIHKKDPNTVLLLVGNGVLEAEIREKVRGLHLDKVVVFAGVRSDIPQLLSAMDVFLFPSVYEGMPNTVIEAQATGLPCVIADTITKEANITNLVTYMSLKEPIHSWSEMVLHQIKKERVDTKQFFIDQKYDIHSVINEFIKLVFLEEGEA